MMTTRTRDLLESEITAALLATQAVPLHEPGGQPLPLRYIWDLYSAELGAERVYARLRAFIFGCGLRVPVAAVDDAFFNTWRHDAFMLAHIEVPTLDVRFNDTNGLSVFPLFLTDLAVTLSQQRPPGSYQRPYKVTLEPVALEHMVQQEINTMPAATAPNLAGVGNWFSLLDIALELVLVTRSTDWDAVGDLGLGAAHEEALVAFFTWFKGALDYEPAAL